MARNNNFKIVENKSDFGVYLWEMPDGKIVADEDGNWMLITSRRGDLKRIAEITAAARSFGIEGGRAVFLAGRRPVTDEEYERQQFRLSIGLIPDDEYDFEAIIEEAKAKRING